MNKAGKIERFCGWAAGHLLVIGAQRALDRGDYHEFDHIVAAIRAGNTGPGSHDKYCLLDHQPFLR